MTEMSKKKAKPKVTVAALAKRVDRLERKLRAIDQREESHYYGGPLRVGGACSLIAPTRETKG